MILSRMSLWAWRGGYLYSVSEGERDVGIEKKMKRVLETEGIWVWDFDTEKKEVGNFDTKKCGVIPLWRVPNMWSLNEGKEKSDFERRM